MNPTIYIDSNKYPKRLSSIKNSPKGLFAKGNFDSAIFDNCISIVGSRKISSYGREVVTKIVPVLVSAGITVVSGFMYGVDALSHKICVKSGGRTIAVMPCGIDNIHPENQKDLYHAILDNRGLVISEYEGSQKPQIWMYPQRNRIVAGLSQATLVVEGGIDSGSLISANYAKKFGRKVFAVPGNIFSENSQGIYQLIGEGASMVTSAFDILDFYQFGCCNRDVSRLNLFESIQGELRKNVYQALSIESLTVDELARSLGVAVNEISSELTMMLLDGLIYQEEDKYYVA